MNRRNFLKSVIVAAAGIVLPGTILAKITKAFSFGTHDFSDFHTLCCTKCGISMDLAVDVAGYEECFGILLPNRDLLEVQYANDDGIIESLADNEDERQNS